jgi:O-antigen ligase
MILLPYLKPYNFTLIPWLDDIYKVWKVVVTLFILIEFAKEFIKKRRMIEKRTVFLWLFLFTWGISLLLNGEKQLILELGVNILSIFGVSVFFENIKNNQVYKKLVLQFLYVIAGSYSVLNLVVTILGHPFGAKDMVLGDNANFLGGDNYSAFILITLCGVMFFYDDIYVNKIRIRTYFFSACGLMSLIIPFSLTGLIAYLFLIVLFCLRKNVTITKLFSRKNMLVLAVVITCLIAFFDLSQLFNGVLEVVGKTGFNGRDLIWPRAVTAIFKRPLVGYGAVGSELSANWEFLAGANHTHNVILEYPFSTGLIGTLFFIIYLFYVFKGIHRQIHCTVQPLLLTMSSFILCSIFDFYIGLIYFYLLLELIAFYKDENRGTATEYKEKIWPWVQRFMCEKLRFNKFYGKQ